MPKEHNTKEIQFNDALGERYLAYALSTIMSRSLPDVRDGLKPVHRRLLYAMLQLKLDPKTGYKKCARIVGDVIGKYHPHGESSVYDALVRMAQIFSSRYPLIEGQGNFGSIDGDNQAAMRYTEAKLTEYAMLVLQDINDNTINFKPTYDNSEEEPELLPSAVPNILANGTEGIAVGMATSIPPHNLLELCDALLHLIKHPAATIESLLKYIKGPDLPTGGIIIEPYENILRAYQNGRGSFRLRAKWEKEDLGRSQYRIVVTEIPYQIQKRSLIEKMATLYTAKKLPFLDSFQDMSAEDIRIIITPKNRNIPAESIMESLFKLTDLEVRVPLNMNVLDANSVPQVMDIKQVLTCFISHRKEIVQRRINHRLGNIDHRLEVLAGLLIVYLNLDEVIRIIRDEDEPKQVMVKKWKLTDVQVESILNTRLRSLRKLEELAINKENEELSREKKELKGILASPEKLMLLISDEIKLIKNQFSKNSVAKRKTEISAAPEAEVINLEAFIEKEAISVVCSEMGWLRAVRGHALESIKYKEGDNQKHVIEVYTNDKVIFFSNYGKFYALSGDKISRGKGDGDPIRLIFDLAQDENILSVYKYVPEEKFLLVSDDGKGFIVQASDLLAQTRGGKQIMTLSGPNAIACLKASGSMVVTLGENRRLLVFNLDEIPLMKRGRGVTLQKLKQGKLKDVKIIANEEEFASITGNAAKNIAIWKAKRGGLGRLVLGKLWVDR
jgi:topoisomerase-4 subunit A